MFVEMSFLNFNQLPAAKKDSKNRAFQQTFGPSHFNISTLGTEHVKILKRDCHSDGLVDFYNSLTYSLNVG